MIDDIEVWRNASDLVKHHGSEAPAKAERQAELALSRDNAVWYLIWRRVEKAADEILRGAPEDGEARL